MAKRSVPAVRMTGDPLGKVYVYLLPVLMFLAVTAISRKFTVGFVAVCLLLCIGCGSLKNLRSRANLLTLGVALYSLVCLASGLWSHFADYAGQESLKFLVGLSLFALLLCRGAKETLNRVLWSLNGALAVVSLLCIDSGSAQLFSHGFSAFMDFLKSNYPVERMGYEAGIRVTGIYGNANVAAGLIAFGLIISLYLYKTARCEKGRIAAAVVVGVEALAFFLSFSMGAMAAFAVTCLVYVLCAGKGERLPLFLLMLECVAVTVLCAFAATPFLGTKSIVPVLLAFVCGGAIWVIDRFALRKMSAALENHGKVVGIVGGALAAVMVVYVLLAFNMTGGTTLNGADKLSRAVYPDAGEYTVAVDGIDAEVLVYSQSRAQLMMHTNTVLYEGQLSGAKFTVPEDSEVVWFVMTGDGELNAVTLSDGTEVPLGYKLLPAFAANRLQGLKANQNFIQRLVFFEDGIKLWKRSPIIGWGIGGVEGQLTSVQSFYYETLYIHNHLIQILDEVGIIGLASFLFLLFSAVWLLWKHREEERDPIFAMLAACLTMMVAHSMTEVVWSAPMYLPVVFVVFAVMVVRYHEGSAEKSGIAGWAAAAGVFAIVVVFTALQVGTLMAQGMFQAVEEKDISSEAFVAKLETMDALDSYNDDVYQVNIMGNALHADIPNNMMVAKKYPDKLLATEEFDNCYRVATYYFLPLRDWDGFFGATRTAVMQEASNPESWNLVAKLYADLAVELEPEELSDFLVGVAGYQSMLTEFNNSGRMEQMVLEPEHQAFLDCVVSLREAGADGRVAAAVLGELLEN